MTRRPVSAVAGGASSPMLAQWATRRVVPTVDPTTVSEAELRARADQVDRAEFDAASERPGPEGGDG